MAKRRRKHVIIARAYNKRGRLLAVGQNSYTRTHTIQAKYGKRTGRPKAIFIHAEIDAILKAREPVHKIEILRKHADGTPALAKPCDGCALALAEFNVKIVVHT